jgi:RNA polymerase sigma factor (sigma-70 family)
MVRANGGLDAASDAANRIDGGDAEALNRLARDVLAGPPEASRPFLQAILPTIRRTCRGVLGPHHPDLEDAIQDCLIDATRALPGYRYEGNLLHYVTKIAIRRAIAFRRRRAARVRHLQLLEDLNDEPALIDQNAGQLEQAETVRTLIRQLRPIQAEALVLRVVLGYTVEEIASITDAPVNTVKTRLRLGKDTLRKLLDGKGRP